MITHLCTSDTAVKLANPFPPKIYNKKFMANEQFQIPVPKQCKFCHTNNCCTPKFNLNNEK